MTGLMVIILPKDTDAPFYFYLYYTYLLKAKQSAIALSDIPAHLQKRWLQLKHSPLLSSQQ